MDDFGQKAKILMQIVVTIVIITACFSFLFLNFPEDNKKWAMGMIGVIVGYWLR